MACYFCVDVYFNKDNERNEYDEYIRNTFHQD